MVAQSGHTHGFRRYFLPASKSLVQRKLRSKQVPISLISYLGIIYNGFQRLKHYRDRKICHWKVVVLVDTVMAILWSLTFVTSQSPNPLPFTL